MTITFSVYLDPDVLRRQPLWEREDTVMRELSLLEGAMYEYVRNLNDQAEG